MNGSLEARQGGAATAAHIALLALCMAVPALLPSAAQQALALQRGAVNEGELWRLWTAHLVHFGPRHALWDGLAWVALSWGCARQVGVARWALAMGLSAPLLSAAVLWLEPHLTEYRGASGWIVGMVAWLWGQGWRGRPAPSFRLLWALIGLALLAKLGWDVHAGVSAALPPGVALAWSAHVVGAVLGLLACGWRPVPPIRTAPGPRT